MAPDHTRTRPNACATSCPSSRSRASATRWSTRPAAPSASQPKGGRGAELVLLGTRAGPPVDLSQVGAASALVVDGRTCVVDCGRASVTQFVGAGLRLDSIAGIFRTHLHADHYDVVMLGRHIQDQRVMDVLLVRVAGGGRQPPGTRGDTTVGRWSDDQTSVRRWSR